jgi:hypothetical protein
LEVIIIKQTAQNSEKAQTHVSSSKYSNPYHRDAGNMYIFTIYLIGHISITYTRNIYVHTLYGNNILIYIQGSYDITASMIPRYLDFLRLIVKANNDVFIFELSH